MGAALFVLLAIKASATVLYVDLNCTSATPPYTNWTTAATNIQDAVDAAHPGDKVLVTNGMYQTGGCVVYGALTNRVAVTKALTVQSINGPLVTVIRGYPSYSGQESVRCVYMTNGVVLSGFTLTNGGTGRFGASSPEVNGGGLWCESVTALITNCVITGNVTRGAGGGTYSGTLTNCTVSWNTADSGGGACNATLNNCSLAGNWAGSSGGGASNATLNNCSLTQNLSDVGSGAAYSWLSGCIVVSNECAWSTEAQGGGVAFCTLSNCTLIGNSAPLGKGGGAYGGYLEACTLSSNSAGAFGGGAFGGVLTNCAIIGNGATNGSGQGGGVYQAALDNCTLMGNYAWKGGGAVGSTLTNCVVSSNSASLYGGGAYGGFLEACTLTTNSAYMGGGVSGATLINCTLMGNSASEYGGGAFGCVWGGCDSDNQVCTLVNCALIGNQAMGYHGQGMGGGATGATLTNCLLSGNYAGYGGGGAEESTLIDCTLVSNWGGDGAGAHYSTLTRCTLVSNRGGWNGGGVSGGTLNNCALIGNSAYNGGGACGAALNNCTLVGNSASYGGGAAGGTLNNCIVYSNAVQEETNGPNYGCSSFPPNIPATLNYCCTVPLPTNGLGNITNEPVLVNMAGGDLRLATDSPCINAGNNGSVTNNTDLDGNPRIEGGTVDIGAYEFQNPASVISYAWLQQYGLRTDGTADYTDADHDGMNNWQEWIAGTDPTNRLSALQMLAPSISLPGVTVSWQSVSGKTYYLQRGTNLLLQPGLSSLQSNIVGQTGTTSFTDTTATNAGVYFYRVGVQ